MPIFFKKILILKFYFLFFYFSIEHHFVPMAVISDNFWKMSHTVKILLWQFCNIVATLLLSQNCCICPCLLLIFFLATLQKKEANACWNVPAKCFKIRHIYFWNTKTHKRFSWQKMKKTMQAFIHIFQKYGNFWSILMEHFIEHKPLDFWRAWPSRWHLIKFFFWGNYIWHL